ncbi:MAG TPA: hypothetical protein VN039_13560 [Nitrospira sp.]|nr:hypothetical protein [Nitrospira sp.]
MVTTLPVQLLNLWRFYDDRAEAELLIKQLNEDYALSSIYLHPSLHGQRDVLPSASVRLQLDDLDSSDSVCHQNFSMPRCSHFDTTFW